MFLYSTVLYVDHQEDGSGKIVLTDPDNSSINYLIYASAPYEITALNGLSISCESDSLMLAGIEIAKLYEYNHLLFNNDDVFRKAIKEYHKSKATA